MSITVESSAFKANAAIPVKYTGDGEDLSPPLRWSGVPAKTQELALICDDPDAPSAEPWVHWVLYKMAPTVSSILEGVPRTADVAAMKGAVQGKNSWNKLGYGGPSPPKGHGVHHYHFRVYALDTPLQVSSGLTKSDLLQKMEGHILAQGDLVGTYVRN